MEFIQSVLDLPLEVNQVSPVLFSLGSPLVCHFALFITGAV